MLKILYTKINGALSADIGATASLLPVDYDVYATLDANVNFGAGEWTYLRLDNGVYAEEVKVIDLSGSSYIVVDRGQSGSTPQAFLAADTAVTEVLGADGISDIVAQSSPSLPFSLSGGGIAEVDKTGTDYSITVPSPNFIGEDGVVVLGTYPNLSIGMEWGASGCCPGEGGSGVGGGIDTLAISSSILQGNISGSTLNLSLQDPNFVGSGGIAVTGTYPDLTISFSGAVGTGTVTVVTASAGLTITGNPAVNPNIALTSVGITPDEYGGITVNQYGQITAISAGFDPISGIAFTGGVGSASIVSGVATLTIQDADVGAKGLVELADHTAPLDAGDSTSAVTPALLAAVAGSSLSDAAGSGTGEADGLYTNVISGTAITLELESGEKALLIGHAVVLNDSTPTTPYEYGLAVFDAGSVKRAATKKAAQINQTVIGIITGPIAATAYTLATTDIAAGNTVHSSFLGIIKL